MPTFDVTEHPLLSTGALELSPDELDAHARIAEQLLGLAGASLTGDEAEAAKDAIVLQVNYQVDTLPDRDWGALVEERPFKWSEKDAMINPVALRMAGRLVGTGRKRPAASFRPHPRTPVLVTASEIADRDAETEVKQKPYEFDIT